MRPRPATGRCGRLLAVATVAALAAACAAAPPGTTASPSVGSTPGPGAPGTSAHGASVNTTAPPGTTAPAPCTGARDCTLAAAAQRDGLLIGTAAKFGDPRREELEAREFSAVTAENELLWGQIHPERDRWEFTKADRIVAFAEEHHLDLTATHFLWDPASYPSVVPDWVRAITDPTELRRVMREHLQVLHDRYAGKIDRWNVVNEPVALGGHLDEANHFFRVLGPGYPAEAFAMAEQIWPEAQLVLNEDVVEYLPADADALVALATQLRQGGARVDRVGLQAHLYLGEPNWDLVATTVARLAALGVSVDFTEIDVPLQGLNRNLAPIDLDTQAAWAARLVRICLDQPACHAITFWGFDDGDTWLDDFIRPGTRPLLYDAELQPKPMRTAVLNELLEGR